MSWLLNWFKPFHIILSRRVTDEETVQVELWGRSEATVRNRIRDFLADLREARIRHNEDIIEVFQQKLRDLERKIEMRAGQLRALEDQITGQTIAATQNGTLPDITITTNATATRDLD